MMRTRLALLAAACVFVACRSGGERDPFEAAKGAIVEGVSTGSRATSAAGRATFLARYNPASCECLILG